MQLVIRLPDSGQRYFTPSVEKGLRERWDENHSSDFLEDMTAGKFVQVWYLAFAQRAVSSGQRIDGEQANRVALRLPRSGLRDHLVQEESL